MDENLVKELLEQNRILISMMAAQMVGPSKLEKTQEEILKSYKPLLNIDEFIKNIFNIKKLETKFSFTIDDVVFIEFGFFETCVRILKKLLSNIETRPLHLCSKKDKTFFVYSNDGWKKINGGEASDFIRRMLNRCIINLMYVVHNDKTKSTDWKDFNGCVMYKQTDEFIDKIIPRLFDLLFIV
jgi:hypothetical protein